MDDDPIFTTLIALHLQKEDFDCTVLNEACQAKLRIDPNNNPDIFILDYDLRSDLTGLDLCRMITSGSNGAVIMMTVNDTEEAIVSCLDAGAVDYIVKPYRPKELIARIRSTLRRKNDEIKSKKTGQSLLDSHARRLLNEHHGLSFGLGFRLLELHSFVSRRTRTPSNTAGTTASKNRSG